VRFGWRNAGHEPPGGGVPHPLTRRFAGPVVLAAAAVRVSTPLRFCVQLIGFAGIGDRDPGSSGFVMDIAWLTTPASVRRVSLSRAAFDSYGDALIAAMDSRAVYWLSLAGPEDPLPALLQAVRDGQTCDP
jgi:hypothetical protein